MARDLDYQTRIIMNMDYSKEIAKARADAAAQSAGLSPAGSIGAESWKPSASTGASNASVATNFAAPINATKSFSAAPTAAQGAGTTGTPAAEEQPSIFKRILAFFGL